MARNPLIGWEVDPKAVRYVGNDLSRPECLLASPMGSILAADRRGGVVRIAPDGTQVAIGRSRPTSNATKTDGNQPEYDEYNLGGTMPNGIALELDGNILIADIATGVLERMSPLGDYSEVCREIEGRPLGLLNFVLLDSLQRIWITVTTRVEPWYRAGNERPQDGYIALIDDSGARIVADGFSGTNEIRFDAAEEWLYVVESNARHVTRLRRSGSENFANRETYGPDDLGGIPDGFAFDIVGNLWVTLVNADRLIAITPEGDALTLLDDGNRELVTEFERHFPPAQLRRRS